MNIIKNTDKKEFEISEGWESESKLLRKKFPKLTISDLEFERGKENELLKRIEERLQKNRQQVIDLILKTLPND